jgi:hypothetical protein
MRMGAIERMVSGAHVQAVPADARGSTAGATSFADALDQATLLDAAASPAPAAASNADGSTAVTAGGATPAVLRPARVSLGSATLDASRVRTASLATPAARPHVAAGASYRPAHVTETDERVWNDCTWAAATMWIDKLTGGAVKVDREKLRAASGDLAGGSSLGDVVKGARKLLGLDLRGAHDERLTVDALLDRLAAGGGAIVQGSYASLPRSLTRHDPGFAAKGVADSGHAVYVGPLDRATGKVWWDDPLAPAGGSGQWISVKDLKKFMWTDAHGRVSAMATPAGAGAWTATSAASAARGETTASSAEGSPAAVSSAVSAAARSAGVDPLLLRAYLDVTRTTADGGGIAAGAEKLAAAMTLYGRADTALESIGAAQAGATRLAEGAVFAGDVLARWAKLLGRRTAG